MSVYFRNVNFMLEYNAMQKNVVEWQINNLTKNQEETRKRETFLVRVNLLIPLLEISFGKGERDSDEEMDALKETRFVFLRAEVRADCFHRVKTRCRNVFALYYRWCCMKR